MEVINVRVEHLRKHGYANLDEWLNDPSHIYIGRNMVAYVKGAVQSKWHNPFTAKKYGLEECLRLYLKYVMDGPLYNELEELDGKVLGCWCHPEPCHGHLLMELLARRRAERT
jgi:hypothetical protein